MPEDPTAALLVPAPIARGARGAVVAPHHLATAAGLTILAQGGTAADAAIAANAALGVVAPNHCGIGGDAFWLVWDEARGEQVALNGSGRAPSGADPAPIRDRGWERIPLRGPLGITVPGAVRSWADAHRRWGRLPIDRLLAPAIELAGSGFPAWPIFIDAVERTAPSLGGEPWAAGFHRIYRAHGRPWRPGEPVRLGALAGTLERLARNGLDAFYEGPLGERQAAFLLAAGAPFAAADLATHASTWGSPIETTYRGVRVTTHPPNSAGFVALETLNVLAALGRPSSPFTASGWLDDGWIHLGVEASKRAFADRDAHLADPDRHPAPLERLLGREHAATVAATIDPGRADLTPPPAVTLVGGTAYLAAVDAEGNAVSLIQSNSAGFGSGVVDPETGIHYHNRGASFLLDPAHPNVLAPGARTAHSLLPSMLFRAGERRPWIVAGSMGGDLQPQINVQLVSALVDGGADLALAVGAPRWAVEPAGPIAPPVDVSVEPRMLPEVVAALEARGHAVRRVTPFDGAMGHAHAIELVDGGPAAGGTLAAVTDPRSAGLPAVR